MPTLTRFDMTPRNGATRDAIPFLKDQSLAIEPKLNGRLIADVVFLDRLDRPNFLADIFRPNKRDAFLIEFDDGKRYGGLVWDVLERTHIVAGLPDAGLKSALRLVDYTALLDVVPFNEPVASGTLKSQIQAIESNLLAHGITLSAFQLDGPVLGAQIFDWRTARQVFDELSLQSTWVYRIDADGVITFIPPGTLQVITPISEAVGNYRSMSFEDTLNDYRNANYVRYGPHGVLPVTEVFQGDGSTRNWTLGFPLSVTGTGVTTRGVVTVTRTGPAVTEETVDADPLAGTAFWHYNVLATYNNAIVHDAGQPVLGVGESVSITYYGVYPGVAFAADEAEYDENGPFIAIIDRVDVTDPVIGAATAAAQVARLAGDNARVTVESLDPYEPGYTVEIDAPILGVQDTLLITEVRIVEVIINAEQERTFVYRLTAITGNAYRDDWRPFYLPPQVAGGSSFPPSDEVCTVTLHTNDFNGAGTLAADGYTGVDPGISKVAGIGPDGSQAIRATGALQEFICDVASTGREGCCAFWSKTSINDGFFYVAEVRRAAFWILSVYRNDDTLNDNALEIYTNGSSTLVATVPNFWDETTWIEVLIRWRLSTFNGTAYEFDGYVQVLKNGALVVNLQNVQLESGFGLETWDHVVLAPQGDMDDLTISE